MHLFYIDEHGNTGRDLDNEEQPIHWLVGLGVTPGVLRSTEAGLLSLALKHFPELARRPEFEFHGMHIFKRHGLFASLSGGEAVALYSEILGLVREHQIPLFISGIDKPRLKQRSLAGSYTPDHPHKIAFMFMVERIDAWLGERQPAPGFFAGEEQPEFGLLVCDEQKEVDRQMIERLAFWREFGTEYRWKEREIRYLIDTVHYVRSQDSWLIQLADSVAYLFGRYRKVLREKGPRAPNHTQAEAAVVKLWEDNCEALVERYYLWPY